ncbi:MAG: hypothetical protein WA463_00605 [Terriglobales bacterium]
MLALPCAVAQQSQTLANVLKQESIPVPPASVPHLNSQITSYATLNDDREFLIAYYLLNPQDEMLRFPLFITRFDKQAAKWQNIALRDIKITAALPGKEGQVPGECIGSVMRVARNRGWYYLDLHWTPSAGCLLVLKQDLSVFQTLPGSTAAFFASDLLVYSGNMVHFADVHPEALFLYDPTKRESQQIYPPKDDPFRRNFSARLAKAIDQTQCAARGWVCDPEHFASTVRRVEVNDETQALAFQVDYTNEGFFTRGEAEDTGIFDDDQYVYVYQLKPLRWREFSVYDLKPDFGTDSLKELLTPARLQQVFSHPGPHY